MRNPTVKGSNDRTTAWAASLLDAMAHEIAEKVAADVIARLAEMRPSAPPATESENDDPLLTFAEAALRYSLSLRTVERRVADGVFPPAIRIGRKRLLRQSECDARIEKLREAETTGSHAGGDRTDMGRGRGRALGLPAAAYPMR